MVARTVIPVSALMLAACGANTDALADLRRQSVEFTPVTRAVGASNTFFFCRMTDANADEALCEACDVSLHSDVDDGGALSGFTAWGTHFYHETAPRNEGEAPRIGVTGERANQRFVTTETGADAARAIFDNANAWCAAQGRGEQIIRKDEIDSFVQGAVQ